MIQRPWVVLLAAGGSRRFGSPKQLARIGGESLLRRMARIALASDTAGCVAVLGARASRLRRELAGLDARVVIAPRWREGIARSLGAGIAALPAEARGALVLLADQAAIEPFHLDELTAAWRNEPRRIVAACADGRLGPPAIIPRRLFRSAMRMRGDTGARELLRDPAAGTIGIELPAAAFDVDRAPDLAAARRRSVRR